MSNNNITKAGYSPEFKLKATIFLAGVSGISALFGFGATLAAAKKQDPKYFGKGIEGSIHLKETGVNLAVRALGWGTLYAFTGCGVFFYAFEEFRNKAGSILPRIPKKESQGRTEFTGLNDLLDYLQHQKSKKDK